MYLENTPYWKTLQPIIESGAMQSAIDGTYRYPYRINIYPGTSCMFSCLFCGRNYDAVVKGHRPNIFSQLIFLFVLILTLHIYMLQVDYGIT